MSNEIVKYDNSFNKIGLRAFTANQLNLLMAICSKIKEKGEEIIFEFSKLKELIKLEKNYTEKEFIDEIISINKKLLSLNFVFENEREIIQFVLFSEFKVDKNNLTLTVNVNKKFSFLLNTLTSNFTRFELEEFVSFKSSYTKEFFRRMKQYKETGLWIISLEDFKHQLDIPKNYRITDIDSWVLSPIKKELKDYKLKIIKKYDKKRRGRPSVVGFEFRFDKEKAKKIFKTVDEETLENIEQYKGFKFEYLQEEIKYEAKIIIISYDDKENKIYLEFEFKDLKNYIYVGRKKLTLNQFKKLIEYKKF